MQNIRSISTSRPVSRIALRNKDSRGLVVHTPFRGERSRSPWGQLQRRASPAGNDVCMTFEDLPQNVKDIPLTDRRLAADVIDLLISEEDRAGGCVGLMVCDEEHRGILPIVLSDVPHNADVDALTTLLDLILPLVVE